jgi:urease subunit gamma/beta
MTRRAARIGGLVHLTPREIEKLMLHQAGVLAQKRLARGLRLNYPEAIALIATQLLELIRDGKSVAELMSLGRTMLGRAEVMDGVPEMIAEVQVEGTFKDGCKLVTVHHPIVAAHGDLALALHGSFLPVPHKFAEAPRRIPVGEVIAAPGELELNAGRESIVVVVTNVGDRPIQVGSHYPFFEVNRALVFDRARGYGMRLDIPAGTAVRFEPGEEKSVPLTRIAGAQVVRGGNDFAPGPLSEDTLERGLVAVDARISGHGAQQETAP